MTTLHAAMPENRLISRDYSRDDLRGLIDLVARRWNVTRQEILGRRRCAHIAEPRQVVMYIARTVCRMPSSLIADEITRSDHTTILYGQRSIARRMTVDADLMLYVEAAKKEFLDLCKARRAA